MSQQHHPAAAARPGHRWYFYPGILLLVLAVLAGGFLGFLTVTEYRPEAVEPALAGEPNNCPVLDQEEIRILSFNTGYASLGMESDFLLDGGQGTGMQDRMTVEANMNGISDLLAETDADFYMLQEVDLDSRRTFGIQQLDAYAQVLAQHQWFYAPNFLCSFVPYPIQAPFGQINSGIATYSRYQVAQASRIRLPNPFSWPVRTANLKRCMLVTRIPMEGTDAQLVVVNFHLEAYDDGAGKAAQTQQLFSLLEEEYARGNYVIAGGDFNQIFPGVETDLKPTSEWVPAPLDPLPPSLEGWRYAYDDTVPTCRLLNQPYDPEDPRTQYYVIDGFIVSPNLEIRNVQTLSREFVFSDHNPVVMEVAFR